MAFGTVIAALIGAGASLYAGEKQGSALDAAGRKAELLGERAREDSFAKHRSMMAFNQDQLSQQGSLQREQMALSERMQTAALGQQKARDMANRQKERYNRAISLINNNSALKTRMRSIFGGK